MTKYRTAISIICTNNWCNEGCPMFDRKSTRCMIHDHSESDLVKIARKEYERKSKKKDGADYKRLVAEEWAIIGKGAKVV